jgi:hypothetical protein
MVTWSYRAPISPISPIRHIRLINKKTITMAKKRKKRGAVDSATTKDESPAGCFGQD